MKRSSSRNRRPRTRHQAPKKKRLNLRKTVEFKYELDKILDGLPETITGTLKGSIFTKADKMGMSTAIEFIESKVEDGTVSEETASELTRVVKRFCTYR